MSYIFICDLDGTFSEGAFIPGGPLTSEDIAMYEDAFQVNIIKLTDLSYIQTKKNLLIDGPLEIKKIKKNLATIKSCMEEGVKFSIATFNRGKLTTLNFIQFLITDLFSNLANDPHTSIESDHIFDFIKEPFNKEPTLTPAHFDFMKNVGKNLHIVMSIITELFPGHLRDVIFNTATCFLFYKSNHRAIPLDFQGTFTKIEDALENVFFFDDDENNIKLAEVLGVKNTYLVDNSISGQNFSDCLKKAKHKVLDRETHSFYNYLQSTLTIFSNPRQSICLFTETPDLAQISDGTRPETPTFY